MKRDFIKAVSKPVTVQDSRFGIRKMTLNPNERPSIFTYNNPNRHWWGTN